MLAWAVSEKGSAINTLIERFLASLPWMQSYTVGILFLLAPILATWAVEFL
jgi:hypothetical protein